MAKSSYVSLQCNFPLGSLTVYDIYDDGMMIVEETICKG